MVDKTAEGLLAKLRLLSKRELQVLDLRCQGMKYADIGKALFIAVPTVKTDMGRVYMKLGLDVIEPSQRLKVLYDTVGPLLQLIKAEIGKAKAGSIEKTPAPEVVNGEVIGEQEEPIPPDVEDMVNEDEKAIVTWTPAPLVAPRRPPQPRRIWPVVLIIGVVLGIFLGAAAVYWLLRSSGGPLGALPQPSPIVSTSPINQGVAATPTQVPLNTTTAIVAPTDTSVPTFTAVAATVPPPTDTPFVPPADGILFQDNFDNGMSPDWHIYTGKWIVANGKLTKLAGDPYSSLYDWIGLEKPEWKNYIVDVTINEPDPQTEEPPIALAVRDNTTETEYIGFELNFWPWIYLSLISDDYSKSSPIAGQNKDFSFPLGTDVPVEIQVKDNTYTLMASGRQVQTVTITGYDSGGIRLGLDCQGTGACPTFDNVKVTYLP